jgi:hypothetical protein
VADGPALALQAALVARLRADAAVAALVGARVHDEPPQAVALPYLRIKAVGLDPLRMDGHTDWRLTVALEAHSRPVAGRVEATKIAEAVVTCLDGAALTVAGFACDWCWFVTQAAGPAADGRSHVATTVFDVALSA